MDNAEGGATIYVRLRDGRSLDSTSSTGYAVNPLWWDAKREEIKANIVCDIALSKRILRRAWWIFWGKEFRNCFITLKEKRIWI